MESSGYVEEQQHKQYLAVVETNLSTDIYKGKAGINRVILPYCIGHIPNKTEVDVPLTYADYFIEAMKRCKSLK